MRNYLKNKMKERLAYCMEWKNSVDIYLANKQITKKADVEYYKSRGAEPVTCNNKALVSEGYDLVQTTLYSRRVTPTLRHDPRRLARSIMYFYRKLKK